MRPKALAAIFLMIGLWMFTIGFLTGQIDYILSLIGKLSPSASAGLP